MFNSGLLVFAGILAAVWFWLDSARARELATAIAIELCQRRQLQFLDGSAALDSIRLLRTHDGLRFRRVFSFRYYKGDGVRHQGSVTLIGAHIKAFELEGSTLLEGEFSPQTGSPRKPELIEQQDETKLN